jgi:hypothetical protein
MSENKTIESMTERQRQAVAARLTIAQARSPTIILAADRYASENWPAAIRDRKQPEH